MKSVIFGQDGAIESVVSAIKRARAGLNEETKPIASLLFVGRTGVGKTELARQLSKNMDIPLLRYDMSEYQEKHSIAKLIGTAPGYVGYEEGGLLIDAVRKNPHSILLLDEIEKAHEDIYNILLQIMDYATLTENSGRKADFRNVVIIMTSNAGASDSTRLSVGFGSTQYGEGSIDNAIKKQFTPEFRNRINKVVLFNPLSEKMAKDIVVNKLSDFIKLLKNKNIDIKAIRGFGEIENAYQVCKDMITENPQIKVLYVSWDRPALLVIKALKEMHREDIAIFTTDLDYKIAQYMESGIVKGLSTQRPYEQGRTAAHVVAKSLLSNDVPKYVGVQPYVVDSKQLGRAWKDIFHEGMPEEIK